MSRDRHHRRSPRGFRRGARIADLMTAELTAFYERTLAAERCGDLEEALEYYQGIPMFRRSRHRALLGQLLAASSELTPWVWARWIVYQAIRCEDRRSRTGVLLHAAMHHAVESFHGDLMDTAYDVGGDPVKVLATVMGESWVCHQLAAHEYGGLATFLDEFVDGALAEHAELARSWVGARMRGLRVVGGSPLSLEVVDLASDRRAEVLDLGARSVAGTDGWVIGRLVPSGTTPGLMFDIAPLPVDESTARRVADAGERGLGRDGWVVRLAELVRGDNIRSSDLLREDYELLSDVPGLALLEFATRPTELARVMAELRGGRDEIGRAAFRVLRSAADGSLDEQAAPYVAAATLNVHGHTHALRRILAPGQQRRWREWAERVPAPARGRLLHFAEVTAEAA